MSAINLKNLPSGWLPSTEAIKRIVWSKQSGRGAKERDVAEEAWRELCGHAFEGRIGAVIRTESDVALEADCAQFITLQERYLFHAGTQGYWLEDEQRYVELEVKPNRQFLDKQGRSVCGEVLFSESDLKALFDPEIDVFGAEQWLRPAEGEERDLAGNHAGPELEAPDKTPFPGSRMPELVDFLTNFHRKQTVSGGSCSGDAAALEAARSHFSKYVITRKMVRDARRTAGCLGRPGKRLNHAEK